MRNLRLFKILVSVLIIGLTACTEEVKETPSIQTHIDIKVLHPTIENLSISAKYTPIELTPYISPLDQIKASNPAIVIELKLDKEGVFDGLVTLKTGYYDLIYKEFIQRVFIEKGKDFTIHINAGNSTMAREFSGEVKYESQYLGQQKIDRSKFIAQQPEYYYKSENEVVTEMNEFQRNQDSAWVKLLTQHPRKDSYFIAEESVQKLYFMANQFELFPHFRSNSAHRDSIIQPLTGIYADRQNSFDINNPKGIHSPEFYTYIKNYVWLRAGAPVDQDHVFKQIAFVDSLFNNSDYQDYLRFEAAKEVAKWESSTERTFCLDTLSMRINDVDIHAFLIENIENDTQNISITLP